jgi:predicted DNA-binding transcriptional regulator AlpA
LPANFPDLPPRYLRTPEAARFVGLSIRTLEKHRIYGTGPRYSKLGGRVVYRIEDLPASIRAGADLCQRRAASARNAISSSSSGLCQATSRREMRRIS